MMSKEQFEELTQKFDTLIRLVAGNFLKDAKNKTQKIGILDELGIKTNEIASLVGTTEESVRTLKKRVRKRRKTEGGRKSGEN